jgi:hypothetical protein
MASSASEIQVTKLADILSSTSNQVSISSSPSTAERRFALTINSREELLKMKPSSNKNQSELSITQVADKSST